MNSKINNFFELDAWKQGHIVVLEIYKITKDFPAEERYGLVSQMRRCAVSITSNIAEGFSRSTSKEKARFYEISLSSATELQNQLIIAKDIHYISSVLFNLIYNKLVTVHKLANGLIKSAQNRFK